MSLADALRCPCRGWSLTGELIGDRRRLIEPANEQLSIVQQCQLLGLSRSSYYYQPLGESAENLVFMERIDKLFTERPELGVRRMHQELSRPDNPINIKHVHRLMRLMGLEAVYQKPNLSKPAEGHQIYPYLLRGVVISQPNQVWSTDITYIPMVNGFLYLCVVIDWYTRFILGWRLSNTLLADFCVDALADAFRQWGQSHIFNTDQGSQFKGLLEALAGSANCHQYGLQRAGFGQHFCGTLLANLEIRACVLAGLRGWIIFVEGAGKVCSLLQLRT